MSKNNYNKEYQKLELGKARKALVGLSKSKPQTQTQTQTQLPSSVPSLSHPNSPNKLPQNHNQNNISVFKDTQTLAEKQTYINKLYRLANINSLYNRNSYQQPTHPQVQTVKNGVALQNVNLIQFNNLGQNNGENGIRLVAPFLQSQPNTAVTQQNKNILEQQERARLELKKKEKVSVVSSKEKKNNIFSSDITEQLQNKPNPKRSVKVKPQVRLLPRKRTRAEEDEEYNFYLKEMKGFLDICEFEVKFEEELSRDKVEEFLRLIGSIQLGCPRRKTEFILRKGTARTQYLIFIVLNFVGVKVESSELKEIIMSNNFKDMVDCLFIFVLLFERFLLLRVPKVIDLKRGSSKRPVFAKIMSEVGQLKLMFLNKYSGTRYIFVEDFKKKYSLIWDDLLSLCGQMSPLIRTCNVLSRSAFRLIKECFMLQVFKKGYKPKKLTTAIKIREGLFLQQYLDEKEENSPFKVVSRLHSLSRILVSSLLASFANKQKRQKPNKSSEAEVIIPKTPTPSKKLTQTVAQKRPRDFKSQMGRTKVAEQNPRSDSAPQKDPRLSPLKVVKKKAEVPLKKRKKKALTNNDSDLLRDLVAVIVEKEVVEVEIETDEEKEPLSKKTKVLREKVYKIENTVQGLNVKIDKLLSTIKFIDEALNKK